MKRLSILLALFLYLATFADGQAIRRSAPMATVGGGGGGIAEVGSGSQRCTARTTSADPLTCAYPGSVTAGNLLIVAGVTYDTTIDTVTDTVGTSYTVVETAELLDQITFIAYGLAAGSGANTVSVDRDPGGAAVYTSYAITEFSGVHATPLDADGGSSTNSSTTPSDAITTVAANALIIGVVLQAGSASTTITPSGSYTQFGEEEDWDNWLTYNAVFRVVTTATSYNVDWTFGALRTWRAQTMSFKPA